MMHGLLHIMQQEFEEERTLRVVFEIRDSYIEKMMIPQKEDRIMTNAELFVKDLKQEDGELVRNFENLVFQEFAKAIYDDIEVLSYRYTFDGVSRALKKAFNEEDAAHETIKTAAENVGRKLLADFERRFK